jgi:predicted lipoprotein with Yx(FWY)xxD motif
MKTIIAIIVVLLVAWGIYALVKKNNTGNTTNTPATQSTNTGTSSDNSSNTNSNSSSTIGNSTPSPILNTSTSATLGAYLTATNGMTLYKYTKDTPGVSNCSGQCAVQWPPYTVSATDAASLAAASGIAGSLGTITRADGSMQVTYNNVPLYFWYKDTKVGDTTGQNVGGVWFVVKP